MSTIQEYLSHHKSYSEKYGSKTIVLMQVGSFYELYMTNTEGPNLKIISNTLNIICTKKDKSILEVSIKNPYMLGFPLVSADKFISLLIQNSYTVILIDQVTPPPNPQRKCTNIFSPSTYISPTPNIENNYAIYLYFEYESQKISKNKTQLASLLCVGMSAIDVSTGTVLVDEAISTTIDTELALDAASKFISNTSPREIFLCKNGQGKMSIEMIQEYLQIDTSKCKVKTFNKPYEKLAYQEEFLKQIYKNSSSVMSMIETLDLEHTNYARLSLIMLIDIIRNYSEKITENLAYPKISSNADTLILGNNAVYQLSVIEPNTNTNAFDSEFTSLYDVVCNERTPMGKRYLRHILQNPFVSNEKIQGILTKVELMTKNNHLYKSYQDELSSIADIEKLKRKMLLHTIQPYELADLIVSFELIVKISAINPNFILNIDCQEELNSLNIFLSKTFIQDELRKNLLNDIKSNFFVKNYNSEIDLVMKKFDSSYDELSELKNLFEWILNYKTKSKKSKSKTKSITKSNSKSIQKDMLSIQNTKSEGYYLIISNTRYQQIKTIIKQLSSTSEDSEEIEDDDDINISDRLSLIKKFDFNKIICKELKSQTKIFLKETSTVESSDDILEIYTELTKTVLKVYIETLSYIGEKFGNLFDKLSSYITQIDYIQSNASIAIKYGYVKPTITNTNSSYVDVENLRHPIVERIIDYTYVPHSMSLGREQNGVLIYGLNASGKSVLMKAIGLSIIMAQCGMYVPATRFELSPYNSIYTRITGNDNIFKGQSSFTLEMTELNAILKRSTNKTLVIGDEVCRGTEHISGNAIVASTIITLAARKSTFIFATHLHELVHLEKIKTLPNVKAYHLTVDFDPKHDTLIYDRRLKEGSGDKVYGILVAKYIIQNPEFMELTLSIKNELNQNFSSMISGKTSRYNSKLFVYKCQLCNSNDVESDISPLQTHHINFQSNCDEDGRVIGKENIQKNSLSNLIVICESCHQKVHHNSIEIESYEMTSKGKKIKIKSK
jgi:DNA mismatch repair protein MutS